VPAGGTAPRKSTAARKSRAARKSTTARKGTARKSTVAGAGDAGAPADEADAAAHSDAADAPPQAATRDAPPQAAKGKGGAPTSASRGLTDSDAEPRPADPDAKPESDAEPEPALEHEPQEHEPQEHEPQEHEPQEHEPQELAGGKKRRISRRALIQAGLIGGAGVAALPLVALVGSMSPTSEPQPTNLTFSLNTDWLFGGQYMAGSESLFYDDSSFAPVALPYTVAPLSWRYWNADTWQQQWIYRRHFDGGPLLNSDRPGNRIFIDFDGVMVNATVVINDQAVASHQGGYLPFSAELTGHVTAGDNLLAVVVDSRCLPVPPISYGHGPFSIDYFQPGGIYRDVRLHVVPRAFLSDLFALPVDVLSSQPHVDIECTIDSTLPASADGTLLVELLDGSRLIATQAVTVSLTSPGLSVAKLSLTGLGPISLWSTETPKLYTVQATLTFPGAGSHVLTRRIGFREASFQPDGFYLNGERLQLFGLNRHQLFPYAGMAMPARVQRKDAEILKEEFNCNMVRCSHYPQSPHFLDACDELGLLVWEEAPGWHDASTSPAWQDLVVQNVHDMVIRDRSRPSVIVWGTRLNETRYVPGLWAATRQVAAQLDGSRPSSGALAHHSMIGWSEDVFAYDDYHRNWKTGDAWLEPPFAGVPYLITESVGVYDEKPHHFAWTDPPARLADQAVLHAQVHSLARSDPAYSGLLGWAGFDYASPMALDADLVKWAGVADGFRIPKPGAAIYQSQVDPGIRPVIAPTFFWELAPPPGPAVPRAQHHASVGAGQAGVLPHGDSAQASPAPMMIASNCERLEVYIGGVHAATALPVTDSPLYSHLAYPPFLVSLPAFAPSDMPELLIEGYLGGQQVTQIRMASDPARDALAMAVDDASIYADGSDVTRVIFRAIDAYGNQRRYQSGELTLTLTGPATLIGDNPFAFGEYGGLGAVWLRSLAGQPGLITLSAALPKLGQAEIRVRAVLPDSGDQVV
jgi:beta-galactosidase